MHRLPTNVEFLFSIHLLWRYLRFDRAPTPGRAALVSLHFALLFYFRLYGAIPWSIALALAVGLKVARKELTRAQLLAGFGTLFVALTPWALLLASNRSLPVYHEIAQRFFQYSGWTMHHYATSFLALSLPFLAASYFLKQNRFFLLACGATLLLLPVLSGLLPFGYEVTYFDRYSSFYVVALIGAALLYASSFDLTRGRLKLLVAGAACALSILGVRHYQTLDYRTSNWSVFMQVQSDIATLPAYEWIARNTDPRALILEVGHEPPPKAPQHVTEALNKRTTGLLSVITRRRKFYSGRLCVAPLTDKELLEVARFDAQVFTGAISNEETLAQLRRHKVTHIFFRKVEGRMREIPAGIQAHLKQIYADERCTLYEVQQ